MYNLLYFEVKNNNFNKLLIIDFYDFKIKILFNNNN